MRAQKWMASCLLLLVTQGLAGVANASHVVLAEKAALLEVQADAALDGIDAVFRHSRLLRAMSEEAYGVMDAASDVRQLSRIGAPLGRLRGRVILAEARLRTLGHLVDGAERLARHGIDPPTCGCVDTLRGQLAEMRATICCLKDRIDALQRRHHVAARGGFGGQLDRRFEHHSRRPPVARAQCFELSDRYGLSIQTGRFRLSLGH